MSQFRVLLIAMIAALCVPGLSTAQSSFIPNIFGPDPGACKKKCDKVKKDCQKEIDRLKSACAVTGNTGMCIRAKEYGCKASEDYCKAMEHVKFGDSKCDPPQPDSPQPTPPTGGGWGDPHYQTFDGVLYSFQSAGEFALVETADDRLSVHVRLSPVYAATSAQSAVGIDIDGTIISFDLRDNAWRVNDRGDLITWDEAASAPVNGIVMGDRAPERSVILKPGLALILVDTYAAHINVDVHLLSDQPTSGLLGNNNGDPSDDMIVAPNTDLWTWLHRSYAAEMRLTENSPLLPYREGESTDTFALPDHPSRPAHVSLNSLETADAQCQQRGLVEPWLSICVYDVAASGDVRFADGLDRRSRPYEVLASGNEPSVFSEIQSWLSAGVTPRFVASRQLNEADGFERIDLTAWTAIGVGGSAEDKWDISTDASSATNPDNARYPIMLLSEPIAAPYTLRADLTIRAPQKDHVGFVLGARDVGLAGDRADFILVDWKQSAAKYRGVPAPEGWRLSAFNGPLPDPLDRNKLIELFWAHDSPGLINAIAESTGDQKGWRFDQTYAVEISYDSDRIIVSVDGEVALDATGQFPERGAIGLYNYSQSNARFANVEVRQ